ncbi:MAG: 50S ribosomal protein L23 [Candidatus Shapirobacteria bacterium]|jgi:ribosomal protein L23
MAKNTLQNTILAPIITEKSLAAQARGVYSFWVGVNSNKAQIVSAFTKLFSIPVLSVRTQNLVGKVKADPRSRKVIHRSDRKRALITIDKKQKIELLNLNSK